jgi:hypothetical protein
MVEILPAAGRQNDGPSNVKRESELNPHPVRIGLHLVAGMRVKIVRRAAIEFVPLAQSAAHVQTQSNNTDSYGTPADRFQRNSGLLLFLQTWQNNHFSLLS